MERYSARTANKMLSALKQTVRMAWNLGYMSAEEYQRAVALKPVSSERPEAAAGRALSFGEWTALFAVCRADPSISGARDAAILALFRVGGLRRSEVADLRLSDCDLASWTRLRPSWRTCETKRSQVDPRAVHVTSNHRVTSGFGDWYNMPAYAEITPGE